MVYSERAHIHYWWPVRRENLAIAMYLHQILDVTQRDYLNLMHLSNLQQILLLVLWDHQSSASTDSQSPAPVIKSTLPSNLFSKNDLWEGSGKLPVVRACLELTNASDRNVHFDKQAADSTPDHQKPCDFCKCSFGKFSECCCEIFVLKIGFFVFYNCSLLCLLLW